MMKNNLIILNKILLGRGLSIDKNVIRPFDPMHLNRNLKGP